MELRHEIVELYKSKYISGYNTVSDAVYDMLTVGDFVYIESVEYEIQTLGDSIYGKYFTTVVALPTTEFEFSLSLPIIIDEPIGYDSFRTTLERSSEHGVSAEVSVDPLEFYGVAFGIVKDAYDTNLDTQLTLRTHIKCADNDTFEELYTGVIDLSTYNELKGDYCSCTCNVGEVGSRTTFTNRAETEFSLVDGVMTSLDGEVLSSVQLSQTIEIPAKGIQLTGYGEMLEESPTYSESINSTNGFSVALAFGEFKIKELSTFGTFTEPTPIATFDDAAQFYNETPDIIDNLFRVKARCKFSLRTSTVTTFTQLSLFVRLKTNPAVNLFLSNLTTFADTNWHEYDIDIDLVDQFIGSGDKLVINIGATVTNAPIMYMKMSAGANCKIYGISQTASSTSKLTLPINAFNRIAELTSDLTVKSDYYGIIDSYVNPSVTVGGGALLGLTDGFNLRQSVNVETVPTLFKSSFKSLFMNLKAIDNIGWGFNEESGQLFIRVEPMDWFYQSDVILTINNPKDKKRTLDSSKIYSRAKIGYKKYMAIEDINAIDTFHTERIYSNGLKIIDRELTQLCDFIADPYSIEFTRRLAADKTTKDWRFDENVFVIALREAIGYVGTRFVHKSTAATDTVISPDTVLNAVITPMRNATRWLKVMQQGNVSQDFNFISGIGNLIADVDPIIGPYYYYRNEPVTDSNNLENKNLTDAADHRILKPETISFDYPLSVAQYKIVKATPYGTIVVDGEDTYLKKIEYSPIEGIAKFILIPKN